MLGSEVVEVGIGMALLFLFMSLIATVLRELIENVMKTRSRDLEKGLVELLDQKSNAKIVETFYNHPLISSLFQGDYRSGGRNLPSYIPRENFSLAMLDMVASLGTAAPAVLSLDSLERTLAGVAKPNAVQRVALMAIQTADGDLQAVRAAVEAWYDGTMDRVSGWYVRRTGRVLGLLGLLAAAFFNVDAVTVGERLLTDRPLREALVAQAKPLADGAAPSADGNEADVASARLAALRTQFAALGLPIGWTGSYHQVWPVPPQLCRMRPVADGGKPDPTPAAAACDFDPWRIPGLVFGWAITALAIMLGAPFWFDTLNRFMIIRSTVKPREKSPDEASRDPQPKAKSGGDGAPTGAADFGQGAAGIAAGQALANAAYEPRQWTGSGNPQAGVL